ncbi:hypothetical protein [uncultured Ruminococcus sp.]|uniref:hypothetical protein n=1 Tax=uncultured Ruminococcus sp. TaxID=165186 RepID=UPI0025958998|nr:hypothetical protein [uncultured Ruminococcus sp.]
MTKKKKILIWIVSILLGGALLYSGAWLYYYYAVCLPHMPAESYGFKIDEDLPQSAGGTNYTADIGDKYWLGCYFVPHFGNFHCSFTITTSTGIDDEHCIVNEDGSVDYIPYNMSGSDFSVSMGATFGLNGKFKDYSFNISRCTETYTSSYLILNEKGELLNKDEQTAADLAIYREALPELMEFIEVTNTVTGVQ